MRSVLFNVMGCVPQVLLLNIPLARFLRFVVARACGALSCVGSVSLPPETKLKKYMKAIGKEAAAGCALRHRERRAYVREQVKALAALAGAEPGMLGPKLPMVRAKTEERRHRGAEGRGG